MPCRASVLCAWRPENRIKIALRRHDLHERFIRASTEEAGMRRLPPSLPLSRGSSRGPLLVVRGSAGVLGGVLHLLADLLHILARAADGVAGGEGTGGEQGKQQQCSQTLHVTSPWQWGGRSRSRASPTAAARDAMKPQSA